MATSEHEPQGAANFHRRAFLKGSGAAAAATALSAAPAEIIAKDKARASKLAGKNASTITLDVNGKAHKVAVEPRMTLLEVLRYRLNLTGAKPVSDDGISGACTVLVAGKPVSASTMLIMECVGKPIQTVEGLAGPRPDPVAKAFVEHDASQCGFCTPGFVIAVKDFMKKHPQATEEQVREGLNGNICRCGTYANIIDAALALAKGGRNG